MTNITIRNIPNAVYQRIKDSAIAHKRSINSEILYGLEQSYGEPQQDQETTLAKIRLLRAKTAKRVYLTETDLASGKSEDRA